MANLFVSSKNNLTVSRQSSLFMRKLIAIVALLCAVVCFSFTDIRDLSALPLLVTNATTKDSVYICDSKTAYAYHKDQDCSGLNYCTHGVYKVSLKDAETVYGRRACKLCDPQ